MDRISNLLDIRLSDIRLMFMACANLIQDNPLAAYPVEPDIRRILKLIFSPEILSISKYEIEIVCVL